VINIGYVTGMLPVTGIPLPFISAGGTSLLITFFVLGMLVSFARHEAPAVAASRRAERLGRRSKIERVLRIPVPKGYVPPRRPSRRPPAAHPVPARAGSGTSVRQGPGARAAVGRVSGPLRPTGTDGRGRGR
jgi:cell division protein FtsW